MKIIAQKKEFKQLRFDRVMNFSVVIGFPIWISNSNKILNFELLTVPFCMGHTTKYCFQAGWIPPPPTRNIAGINTPSQIELKELKSILVKQACVANIFFLFDLFIRKIDNTCKYIHKTFIYNIWNEYNNWSKYLAWNK